MRDEFLRDDPAMRTCPVCNAPPLVYCQAGPNVPRFAIHPQRFGPTRAHEALGEPKGPTRKLVYLIEAGGLLKIGVSLDPMRRLKSMQTGSPVPLTMLAAIHGGDREEARLHRLFKPYRREGEWFEDRPEIRAAFGVEP